MSKIEITKNEMRIIFNQFLNDATYFLNEDGTRSYDHKHKEKILKIDENMMDNIIEKLLDE